MAGNPSEGKLLYHITHLDNMQSILNLGLMSRSDVRKQQNISFTDVADPEILSKREKYKDNLSKYVLFHFYAKNPFDCAVCNTYGPENLAIITIRRDNHQLNDFKIIPSHPLDKDEPEIYPYNEGFARIRWDILDLSEGRDYDNDEIRKACMAECVMEYVIQPEAFSSIFVYDEAAKNRIEAMENSNKVRYITVNSNMFHRRSY